MVRTSKTETTTRDQPLASRNFSAAALLVTMGASNDLGLGPSSKDRPLAVAGLSSKTFLCWANSTGWSTMIGRLVVHQHWWQTRKQILHKDYDCGWSQCSKSLNKSPVVHVQQIMRTAKKDSYGLLQHRASPGLSSGPGPISYPRTGNPDLQ